jgi:hypothetical protein
MDSCYDYLTSAINQQVFFSSKGLLIKSPNNATMLKVISNHGGNIMLKRLLSVVFAFAVMLTVLVVVQAAPFAAPPSPGTAESFGAVQNTGTAVANAVVAYYNQDGTIAATKNITILPKATQGIAPRLLDGTPQQLPSGFNGSVVVSADQDVVAVSYINYTGASTAFGSDKSSGADFGGVNVPANTLYFPSVSNRDNEATEISIQNADATDAVVYLNYYDRAGANIAAARTTSAAIKPGAQATFKLVNNTNLSTGNFLGSVQVTSTSKIAGVAVVHWTVGYGSFGYNAESAGTTSLNFPKVSRRSRDFNASATDCSTSGGGWYDYSGVVAQNLSSSEPATVTVSFYDRSGVLKTSFPDSIPALSSHGYNTRFNAEAPTANMNALGCNFLGSVLITSTGTPIVGIVKAADDLNRWASGYNGVATSAAGNSAFFPYFYHTDYSQSSSTGTPTNWAQWSGAIVQNADGVPIDVYVNVLDRNGVTVVSIKDPVQIGVGAAHGYNARYDASLPASTFNVLPLNFGGGAYITSTGKIVALQSTWNMYAGDMNDTLGFAR